MQPGLQQPDVTELTVNRPGELWILAGGCWRGEAMPALTLPLLQSLANALLVYNGLAHQAMAPVRLPGGERGQVIRPPACLDGMISITIRKHSPTVKSLQTLAREGCLDNVADLSPPLPDRESADSRAAGLVRLRQSGDWAEFLRQAVAEHLERFSFSDDHFKRSNFLLFQQIRRRRRFRLLGICSEHRDCRQDRLWQDHLCPGAG